MLKLLMVGRKSPWRKLAAKPSSGVAVGRLAAVAGVHDHRDAGLVHPRPERVEGRVERAAAPGDGGGRAGAHHDQPGALVERPLELLDRPVLVGQGEVGRGEDAALVVERPVLGEPAVEGAEGDADGLRVVLQRLLVDHPERGEEEAAGEALLVEHLHAGGRVAVLGADRLVVAEELQRVDLVRVAAEVLAEAARLGDRIEGGVGDGPAHLAAEHVVLPPVDRGPLHRARPSAGSRWRVKASSAS